jgi:hypothetical protein
VKRVLIAGLLFLALTAAPLFAQERSSGNGADNHQKIYPVDSEVYQAIKALYISRGLALPSTAGPWSEDELLLMLERIDPASLSGGGQCAYEFAAGELHRPKSLFVPHAAVNVEAYAHSDTEHFILEDQYVRPWSEVKPLLDLGLESFATPYVYLLFTFPLYKLPYTGAVTTAGGRGPYLESGSFGRNGFGSNFFVRSTLAETFEHIDFSLPFRAFVSFGARGWSVQAGRDRLAWGPGESGNFVFGDHIPYHNAARATVYNNIFKYTFSVSSFQNPREYFDDDASPPRWNVDGGVGKDSTGINLFIAHRFEGRFLWDKLNFSITEGLMYQPPAGTFDPQVFSPTIALHNLYRGTHQNSFFVFELNGSPVKNLNVYGQLIFDDAASPAEAVPGSAARNSPSEMGYMLGAGTVFPFAGGMFSASLEGVYTEPFLYLRARNTDAGQTAGVSGINFVVANRDYGSRYAEQFMGYRWGGDAVVVNANAAYRRFGEWNAGANFMYMIHGTHDKWTTYQALYAAGAAGHPQVVQTPTGSHETENHADGNAGVRDAPYHFIALSLSGAWNVGSLPAFQHIKVLNYLSLYGRLDFLGIVNPGNLSANAPVFDVQFSAGVSFGF